MTPPVIDLADLAARIPDGACVVVAKEPFAPMALARALIARGTRGLHLVTAPTSGVLADALIGAGCVATVETSGVSLGEFGPAPFFADAVKSGRVAIRDATCPAVYAGLQAAEKGVPFMPIRGLIGSDILKTRPDIKVVDNPFQPGDPIVLLPAIRPDVALLHVALADRFGNAWVGTRQEARTIAHAARRTLVTAEEITDRNLAEDPAYSAALVTSIYVDALAEAPGGAWPLAAPPAYALDPAAVRRYAEAAAQAVRTGGAGRARTGGAPAEWLSTLAPPLAEAAE